MRPIGSPTGRHFFEVVGPVVRQLHLTGAGMEGDHGLHKEHRLPNVFIVEYRLVNPMTIGVFLMFVMMLALPPTGLLLGPTTTVLYDIGIANYRRGAIAI